MPASFVTADPGTGGAAFATDDVGGVHYPVSKLEYPSAKTAFATAVSVAAGSFANLDSSQITSGRTGKLLQARCSASVPWKAELQTITNGIASSAVAVWFWNDPQPLLLPAGAVSVTEDVAAGLDGFRIVATNLDPAQNADLFAFFVWDEV